MLSDEGKRVKKELENFCQSKRKIENLKSELRYWENLGGAVQSASSEEHVCGGESTPYAERRLMNIERLKDLISKAIDKAAELEDRFLNDLQQLDPLSHNLLWERYFTGKPLKKIIREYNYSDRHIFRLYDVAFEKISENHKDGTKCQF